jgi:hypothetical protein
MEGLEVMGLESKKLEKDDLKGFVSCQEKNTFRFDSAFCSCFSAL